MCGFAGFSGSGDYDRAAVAAEMGKTIAHRGPDSDDVFCDEYVAFAFRRLSIIDLAGGDQPMHSHDGRYVIVFNGEIYNYRELRADLIRDFGSVFDTDSDTEVIIETYAHYGTETASRLRGMFAFVIYDKKTHALYGARDRFGIKPFYYTTDGGHFIFGSEIKSFLPHPCFKKELEPDVLKLYLEFQYSPLEKTIFKGVKKLLPGTFFTYSDGALHTERYFDPTFDPKARTFEDAVKLIDETVLSSVEYHQIADVEVGSFLSAASIRAMSPRSPNR